MFCGGHDVGLIHRSAWPLQAENCSNADTRDQVRIFTVGLFGAAPARIAGQIQHWRQTLLRTTRASFRCYRRKNVVHQIRIPRSGHTDRRWKRCATARHKSVQTLFVEDDRNPQASVVLKPFLYGVGVLRHFAGSALFAGPRNFSDSVFKSDRGALRYERTLLVDKPRLGSLLKLSVLPSALELSHLFIEGHSR